MALLKSPLLSMSANGRLGKDLVYHSSRYGTIAKKRAHPSQPNSLAQQYRQWLYLDALYMWYQLSPAEKASYEKTARQYHKPGKAYYVGLYLSAFPFAELGFYWDPRVSSGGKVIDNSSWLNHGTISGAQWNILPSHLPVLLFNGSSDFVNLGHSASLAFGTTYFSLEVWFKDTRTSGDSCVVSKGYMQSGYNGNWILRSHHSNGLEFYVFDGLTPRVTTFNYPAFSAIRGNYNHIWIWRGSGSNLFMIINGELATWHSYAGNIGNNAYDCYIGKNPYTSGEYMKGEISLLKMQTGFYYRDQFETQHHLFT